MIFAAPCLPTTRARGDTPASRAPDRTVLKSPPSTIPATERIGEARGREQVENRLHLFRARVLEDPQRLRRAEGFEMRIDHLELLRALGGLHGDRRAKRHAALARQRQFERERIEQRLGRDDRVAAILAQLRAISHRRHIQHRQPERRGMIIDIERVGIARLDRKRRSIARIERRNFVAVAIQLLDEQHEVRDRTAAGQLAGPAVSRSACKARPRRDARSTTTTTSSSSDGGAALSGSRLGHEHRARRPRGTSATAQRASVSSLMCQAMLRLSVACGTAGGYGDVVATGRSRDCD